MMKRLFTISTIIILAITTLSAQDKVYRSGEKVSYLIHYGLLNGGIATLEVYDEPCCGLVNTHHASLTGKTSGLIDAIYEVKDIYECYIDPTTELPMKSIRNISEGRYKRYNVVTFDRETRQDSAILTSDLTGEHITQHDIHDIISCFYWFRNHTLPENIENLAIGDTLTINTWFTDEYFPIILRYAGIEEVKTKSGKINCYKFNPVCEVGRLFKSEDGLSLWFSADRNYLPVKIRFEIFVGAFEVDMYSYEGLKYPLDINKK